MSADSRRAPHRQGRRVGTVSLMVATVVTAAVALAPTAGAVPLPPPNPSDQQIQASKDQAAASATRVGELSGQLSATRSKIRQLRDAMELKAELAMKARVDVQMAQMAADDAAAAADRAQQAIVDASRQIDSARDAAARFAAASYRQGSVLGSVSALLGSGSMDELLARQQMIEQVSANQASVIDQLKSAQVSKANMESAAREAVKQAHLAQQKTEQAQRKAVQAQQQAADSFAQGQRQLSALEDTLREQQDAYQDALNNVAALKGQRAQYRAWLATKRAEDKKIAQQAAVYREHAQTLEAERQLFRSSQAQEEKNREIALQHEKERQAKLQAERDRLEAAGLDPDSASLGSSRGAAVVQAALKYLGTPYAWGGGDANGPTRGIHDWGVADSYGDYNKIGFDCSGLALYAWAQVGVYLPHYSGYQYRYGTHIASDDLQPGDLVFYAYNTSNPATIHHVAIYMGNGKMIQAPQSGSVVKISPMRWSGYIGATRPGT